jgi:molybdate-binding protein
MSPTQPLSDFAQLKTLADTRRLALLRRLMAGPASLTQLGQHFGETPAHIRHHLKALEQAGLVELDSTRPARGFTEKFYRATADAYLVHLAVLPDVPPHQKAVVLGTNDQAAECLADYARQKRAKVTIQLMALDSLAGLISLRQGLCHMAGCHLLDPQSGEYNTAYISRLFPGQAMSLIRLAQREMGLIIRPGNPLQIRSVADLPRSGVRFVNRERGSGTRLWLDRALQQAGIRPEDIHGYAKELGTHLQVAQAVFRRRADVGLGLASVARQFGLDFVPLFEEPYDLVLPQERLGQPSYQSLFDLLCSGGFRRFLTDLTGYNAGLSGASRLLSA